MVKWNGLKNKFYWNLRWKIFEKFRNFEKLFVFLTFQKFDIFKFVMKIRHFHPKQLQYSIYKKWNCNCSARNLLQISLSFVQFILEFSLNKWKKVLQQSANFPLQSHDKKLCQVKTFSLYFLHFKFRAESHKIHHQEFSFLSSPINSISFHRSWN